MSDERHPHRWGFADTRLEIEQPRSVRMTGTRYPLSGVSMPHLIPFVESTLGVPFDPSTRRPESTPIVPPPVLDAGFMAALEGLLPADRRTTNPDARLAHSHGQLAVGEIDRLLYGGRFARVVDVVVEPIDEDDVRAIVTAAAAHDVCLVPFGGGTNVSGALLCPEGEARTIVSIDMRRMRRVLSIDRENSCALVEAGITGTELERILGDAGYACGHTPDSMEFSTLGGWIATNASGMKKNRYGNI
ncbi:MAG TPA: FAD-dependent oxidoreductase, partial [Vicinamibacterales bacterium]|nr:FAD-dependent oxidoreductase [Vicinamibacterales bacterium]